MEHKNRSNTRFLDISDTNVDNLREKYPNGLHFVVGDTHGQAGTLRALMEKIKFDHAKDHIYFVGDYNAGGNPHALLSYMSQYYSEDYSAPGFHMILGNHERWLFPIIKLNNLPDIIVLRAKNTVFFIAHAGMVAPVFSLLCKDLADYPDKTVFAYGLDEKCTCKGRLTCQITWSMYGLYTQHWHSTTWPRTKDLLEGNAMIIHGHSPYSFFVRENRVNYGDDNVFFTRQHIIFSEDLQSFNIDSDIKGRCANNQTYRGITAICLDALDDIKTKDRGISCDDIMRSENFAFGQELLCSGGTAAGDIRRILDAAPVMKMISLDEKGQPFFVI